jgi:hypothetical protein
MKTSVSIAGVYMDLSETIGAYVVQENTLL